MLNVPPMLPNAARMGRSLDVHFASSLVHWVGLDRRDIAAFAKSTATTAAIANLSRPAALLQRFRYPNIFNFEGFQVLA